MLDTTYGYEIINGGYRVQKTEARYVRNVIEKVIAGVSSTKVADWLNANHISTRKKGGRWTHTMIFNMVRNRRYSGELGYPKIINKNVQETAIRILDEKSANDKTGNSFVRNKESPFYKKIRCSKCGGYVFLYEDSGRRYWRCIKKIEKYGKKCGIYHHYDGVRDEEINDIIIDLLNDLILGNLSLKPQGGKKHNHIGIVKIDNQIKELMRAQSIDFKKLERLVQEKNEKIYEQYKYDTSSETMTLKRRLMNFDTVHLLDKQLIDQFIKEMELDADGRMRIILWNDQIFDRKVNIERIDKNG